MVFLVFSQLLITSALSLDNDLILNKKLRMFSRWQLAAALIGCPNEF